MSSTLVDPTTNKLCAEAVVRSLPFEERELPGLTPRSSGGPPRLSGRRNKRILWVVFGLVGIVLVMGAFWMVAEDLNAPDQSLVFYTVRRGDLPITVTESGNLESQQTTEIRSEVENISSRSGNNGTQIIFIIPNGKMVEKGELLVELDSAAINDRLDGQVLDTERARSMQIQANVRYENQKTQNITALENAKLAAKIAELDLKQYQDEEGGTFQIEIQTIDLAIQEAQATQVISANDLKGTDALKRLGYRGKGDLEKARLTALSADRKLAQNVSQRTELLKYTFRKQKLTLDGAVGTARRRLKQVSRDNVAVLEQAKAAKDAADRSLAKEEEKLKKYTQQLTKCKIHAPHAGMAAYAINSSRYSRSSSAVIAEGAMVYKRQKIISLPVLSRMQVKTAVHESVLHQVHAGLRASIKIETFPDKQCTGTIESVAVLPDPGGYFSSNIKIYKTIVKVDGEVSQLKPGMTAVVDIHVKRLKDILSVPVQAIVQIGRDKWCYIDSAGSVERRIVQLGQTNEKFVEIREGLNEGDRVVLNPMAIMDEADEGQDALSPEEDSEESDLPLETAEPKKSERGAQSGRDTQKQQPPVKRKRPRGNRAEKKAE